MNKIPSTPVRYILCALLLASTTLAVAAPDRERPGRGHGEGPGGDPTRQLAGVMQHLDLDETQKASIEAIIDANREDLQGNQAASRALKEEVRALVETAPLDQEQLAELARRSGELAEERVLMTGSVFSEVLAVLDDGQRDALNALRSVREQHRRERFSARRERD